MSAERRRRTQVRGTTLLEVVAAMAVMLIGAVGVAGLNTMGMRLDGDGRRITRATEIAADLAEQIALWDYNDVRLQNANGANDGAIGDPTFALERTDAVVVGGADGVDHVEDDLALLPWYGIPRADVTSLGYERYWNVSTTDPVAGGLLDANGNNVPDALRIAVIVRYRNEVGWRRVVLLVTKPNPGDAQ